MLILGSGGFRILGIENTGYLFFRNPPLHKITTFSLGQKGCASYGCAYYKWGQYYKNFGEIGTLSIV